MKKGGEQKRAMRVPPVAEESSGEYGSALLTGWSRLPECPFSWSCSEHQDSGLMASLGSAACPPRSSVRAGFQAASAPQQGGDRGLSLCKRA